MSRRPRYSGVRAAAISRPPRTVLLIGLVLSLVLTATPARAATAAAGPGGFAAGFLTPVVVATEGEAITFVNGDISPHDFVADGVFLPRKPAKKAPWCSGFRRGTCPLFWTPTITLGETTEVSGIERLTAGEQYPFFCSRHPGMKGTLVII